MNIVTSTIYADAPVRADGTPRWHRAQWEALKSGMRAIRYETDYDLTTLLHNLAGGLERAFRLGDVHGFKDANEPGESAWQANAEGIAAP